MKCSSCGAMLEQGDKFCINCGTKVNSKKPIPKVDPRPKTSVNNGVAAAMQAPVNNVANAKLYPPVGIIKFFFLQIILFIPIINVIALFIMAFSSKNNPNVRNYARAALLGFVVMVGVAYATGYASTMIEFIKTYMTQYRP